VPERALPAAPYAGAMTSPSDDTIPDLGAPANRAFAAAGITTLTEVSRTSERELLAMHGVGPRAIRILREAMAERGMDFGAG
jgi:hypothetical protein